MLGTKTLHITDEDGTRIVRFVDSTILDFSRVQQIGDDLLDAADGQKMFIVDFAAVTSMSVAMIAKLVRLNRMCTTKNCELRFAEVTGDVTAMFKLMYLHTVFDFQPNVEAAKRSFEQRGFFG